MCGQEIRAREPTWGFRTVLGVLKVVRVLHGYVYVCKFVCVCMHVYMYVRTCVCMYVYRERRAVSLGSGLRVQGSGFRV
jgi:hypothetical protein